MKAIIFDMDGTLIDSMTYWYKSGKIATEPYADRAEPGFMEKIDDMSAREIVFHIASKLSKAEYMEFTQHWNELMKDYYATVIEAKPYVKEYLDSCLQNKIKMAVATATPKDMAMVALKRLDLAKYFDFIIDEDDVGIGKKSPEIYLEAAKRLGVDVKDCAVFEDNARFARTAKNAGFYTVGIYDDLAKSFKEEMKTFCDIYATNFSEVPIFEQKKGS